MTSDLARRIAFTLGALLLYRVGAHIPLPGLDIGNIQADIFPASAIGRLSLLGLSLTPYLSATFLLQLVALVSRRLRASWTATEHRRQMTERRTRLLAAAIAAIQSFGIAQGLAAAPGLVSASGASFVITTVVTLTGGVFFLIWLSGQITARGIGNGIALILLAGIAPELPGEVSAMLELMRMGAIAPGTALAVILMAAAITVPIVAVERARRRLPVVFAERQAGSRSLPGQTTDLALKLNPAGVVPLFLAAWVASVPNAVVLFAGGDQPGWRHVVWSAFSHGHLPYLTVYLLAVVFFAYVYTAFVCDPEHMADRLQTYGGAIPDIAPGEATAAHLDGVISRVATVGAFYLASLALLPEVLLRYLAMPFYFGSLWLMMFVCITLDIAGQVRAHLAQPG